MKKLFAFVCLLGALISTPALAKNPDPTDFFAGKWKISVPGTPEGDLVFSANLVRVDGVLAGKLTMDGAPAEVEPILISKVEESKEKLTLYFSAKGYDVNVELNKVDSDNLKGSLMGMFEAKGTRVKETK
jgi:hypothetical protein